MAKVTLDLEVAASKGVVAYWIDIDNAIVPISNSKGSVPLDSGDHDLGWHFVGNSGATLSVVGKVNDIKVVEVKSTIPPGDHSAFGTKSFTV
jgi:hypothetical protein